MCVVCCGTFGLLVFNTAFVFIVLVLTFVDADSDADADGDADDDTDADDVEPITAWLYATSSADTSSRNSNGTGICNACSCLYSSVIAV